MKSAHQNLIFITILMLFLIVFPIGIGLVNLITAGDNFPDDNILQVDGLIVTWAWFPVRQLISGLIMGMSIFALFVVYLGSRSSHRYFNDRSIDPINLFRGIFFLTALLRAVFVCHFFETQPVQIRNGPQYLRRYKSCARLLNQVYNFAIS